MKNQINITQTQDEAHQSTFEGTINDKTFELMAHIDMRNRITWKLRDTSVRIRFTEADQFVSLNYANSELTTGEKNAIRNKARRMMDIR